MRSRHWFILVLYIFTMGPGLLLFGSMTRYLVALVPPITIAVIVVLLKDEWMRIDWNSLLRDKKMYSRYGFALQTAIYAMAADTLLFHPQGSLTDDLTAKYPIMAFYVIVLGPLAEEIVFRKIIFGTLLKVVPFWAASGTAAILFGAAHLSWGRFLGYAIVGWVFCYVYRKSGSLLPTVLAHISLNFIAVLVSTLRG